MCLLLRPLALLLALLPAAQADPQLASWFIANSGRYARIYPTTTAEGQGNSVTTWSRGAGVQTLPTYADVSEVSYSASWVYIRTSGLASHVMGPWYLNAAKTQLFPNYPANTGTIYRVPRTPIVPANKTLTGNGAIGYFVNGVAFFDNRDAFSYSTAAGTDATPQNGVTGDGVWNRNAYANELVTFDAALAHQAGRQYHYHVQPIALRYQLGDHVTYNAATNRYAESTAAVSAHSAIIAWASDGYPVYGPYSYSTALDSGSGLRRMVSGYVLRTETTRTTLPAWAAAAQNRSAALPASRYGPAVDATYPLGHYIEDYEHLADIRGSSYDLDRYNGRICVTPEFPGGTYAYFSTIAADGTPVFPYNIGRQFYGSPTGGTVPSITESVTKYIAAGPNSAVTATAFTRDPETGTATTTWTSVDGGIYKVEKSSDLTAWSDLQTGIASAGASTTSSESAASQGGATMRFYRATRTGLANFDNTGFASTTPPAAASESTALATAASAMSALNNSTSSTDARAAARAARIAAARRVKALRSR